jgi:hypothetical protein
VREGVSVEVPGVKVAPRVDIERRDRPVVEERRTIETDGQGSRGGCEQDRHVERTRGDEDRHQGKPRWELNLRVLQM